MIKSTGVRDNVDKAKDEESVSHEMSLVNPV